MMMVLKYILQDSPENRDDDLKYLYICFIITLNYVYKLRPILIITSRYEMKLILIHFKVRSKFISLISF